MGMRRDRRGRWRKRDRRRGEVVKVEEQKGKRRKGMEKHTVSPNLFSQRAFHSFSSS